MQPDRGEDWRAWPEVRDLAAAVEQLAKHRLGPALIAKLARDARQAASYKKPVRLAGERSHGEG